MVCTISSTSTSARAPPTRPRSRSCSWCPGARTGDFIHPAAVCEDDIMFQRQDKEKDAVLLILRCSQEVSCRCAQIHPGIKTRDNIATPENSGWVNLLTIDYFQATDASEASEEAVEKQLRSTDRVWSWPPFLIFYAAPDRGSVGILLDRSIY